MEKHFAKLVLLGKSSVGKSALVKRYIDGVFDQTQPTIGLAFTTKEFERNGYQFEMQFWDTAGEEKYEAVLPKYYRDTHAALIVYDITAAESFERALKVNPLFFLILKWIEDLKVDVPGAIIYLVGNKCDLEEQRVIEKSEGQFMAQERNIKFFETSAKNNTNVFDVFNGIVDDIPLDLIKGDDTPEENSGKVKLTPMENDPEFNKNGKNNCGKFGSGCSKKQ